MSRRIETKTEITDKDLAVQALTQAGVVHDVAGDTIYLKSGAYDKATIDLKTGSIVGDSDWNHSKKQFGLLRQYYSEAKVRAEAAKNGVTIEERQTDQEGNIVLMFNMA